MAPFSVKKIIYSNIWSVISSQCNLLWAYQKHTILRWWSSSVPRTTYLTRWCFRSKSQTLQLSSTVLGKCAKIWHTWKTNSVQNIKHQEMWQHLPCFANDELSSPMHCCTVNWTDQNSVTFYESLWNPIYYWVLGCHTFSRQDQFVWSDLPKQSNRMSCVEFTLICDELIVFPSTLFPPNAFYLAYLGH